MVKGAGKDFRILQAHQAKNGDAHCITQDADGAYGKHQDRLSPRGPKEHVGGEEPGDDEDEAGSNTAALLRYFDRKPWKIK